LAAGSTAGRLRRAAARVLDSVQLKRPSTPSKAQDSGSRKLLTPARVTTAASWDGSAVPVTRIGSEVSSRSEPGSILSTDSTLNGTGRPAPIWFEAPSKTRIS
jgi:hypothetical protein